MGSITYDFDGQTVVVTGGSSGIGRAISLAFGRAGAAVIVASRRPENKGGANPTHTVIRDEGGTAEFVETDVANPDDIRAAIDRASVYSGLDVFVNNAAIYVGGPVGDVIPEELDRAYEVNVRGVYFGCQAAAQDMLDRNDPGTIVNIESVSSTLAQRHQSAYNATKGAVRMITRNMAYDLAAEDIRVNAVAPGWIATSLAGMSPEDKEALISENRIDKEIPLTEIGRPADIANAVLFLASDAATYVTGESIHVDGGYQIY